jgi:hypothetical protein
VAGIQFKKPSTGSRTVKPLALGIAKPKSAKKSITPTEIRKGNAASSKMLKTLGVDYRNPNDKPSFLDKLFGLIQTPATGVESVIHNVISAPDDKLNPLAEMGKSLKGEKTVTGSHIIGDLGINPTSAFGKFVKAAGGVALDMGLDPLTYLSAGFSASTKIKAASEAARLFDTGLDAAKVAELAEFAPKILSYADDAGEIAVDALRSDHAMQKDVWKGILRSTGKTTGDSGGLKFALGVGDKALKAPLLPDSLIGDAVGGLVSKVADTGAGRVLGRAADTAAELVTPFYKNREKLGTMGAYAKKTADHARNIGLKKAATLAFDDATAAFDGVSDEARNIGTVVLQRMDVHAATKARYVDEIAKTQATIDSIATALKGADKSARFKLKMKQDTAFKAMDSVRAKLTGLVSTEVFDPADFKKGMEALGKGALGADDIERATSAFENFTEHMKSIRAEELASGREIADRGLYYVTGVDGTAHRSVLDLLKGEAVASGDTLTASNLDNIRNPVSGSGGGMRGTGANNGAAKDFATIEDRLKAGIGASTDARDILYQRLNNSRRLTANTDYYDGLAKTFGEVIPESVPDKLANPSKVKLHWENGVLTTTDGTKYRIPERIAETVDKFMGFAADEGSVKAFNKGLGTLTTIWKSQALATPGFVMRNMYSNYYLASAHGMGNVQMWKDATRIAAGMADDAEEIVLKGRKWTVADIKAAIVEHAVTNGGQMSELTPDANGLGDVASFLAGGAKKGYSSKIHLFNGKVEDTGRIAVFLQSLDNGMLPRDASSMVDKVLYSYDPNDLTSAEKGLRQIIPFYVWMRRNLPAQVEHLIHDPKVLTIWDKAKDNGDEVTGNTTNWGEMPKYMRDMGAIPIPLPNGKKMYLNPNFGWQDINKLESVASAFGGDFAPLTRDTMGMMSPIFKVPAEIAMNTDSFYQAPIEAYEGELKKAPSWLQMLSSKLDGNPAWEAAKEAGGAKSAQDGTLMVSPYFAKFIQNIPIAANIGRATETGDKQAGRLLSMGLGIKPMADESQKWSDNRAYEDQRNLADAIRGMKALGFDTAGARAAVKASQPKAPTKASQANKSTIGGKKTLSQLLAARKAK